MRLVALFLVVSAQLSLLSAAARADSGDAAPTTPAVHDMHPRDVPDDMRVDRRAARERLKLEIDWEAFRAGEAARAEGNARDQLFRKRALERRALMDPEAKKMRQKIIDERNEKLLADFYRLQYGTGLRGMLNKAYSASRAQWAELTRTVAAWILGEVADASKYAASSTVSLDDGPADEHRLLARRVKKTTMVSPEDAPAEEHRLLARQAKKTTKKGFRRTTAKRRKTTARRRKTTTRRKVVTKKMTTTSAKATSLPTPLLVGQPIYLYQVLAHQPLGCNNQQCRTVSTTAEATLFQRYCYGPQGTCSSGVCTYTASYPHRGQLTGSFPDLAVIDRTGGSCLTRTGTGAFITAACPPQLQVARQARSNVYRRDASHGLGERHFVSPPAVPRGSLVLSPNGADMRTVRPEQLFTFRADERIQVMQTNLCIGTPSGIAREVACASAPTFDDVQTLPTTTTVVATTTLAVLPTQSVTIFPLPPSPPDLDPPRVNLNVPVPTNVKVLPDEFMAQLTWEEGFGGYGDNNPIPQAWDPDRFDRFGITGFVVRWGVVGTPGLNLYTPYAAVNLQPLDPLKTYFAYIRSLMSDGTPSDKSATITFTSDSTRVNALRQQMTGFFADFNQGPGELLERDMNTAFSQCVVPTIGATFLNQQLHAHNLISSPSDRCDRGLVVCRPRAIFDFAGRTGTVVFDLDGSFHRQAWYLDLIPDHGYPLDLNTHINLENSAGAPINMLRFRQQDQNLALFFFDAQGEPQKIVETGWNTEFPSLDRVGDGFSLVRNVRRKWVVKISRTFFSATIDGNMVLNATLNLPFDRGQVQFNTYGYNVLDQDPMGLIHWDNFGFDGPNGRNAVVNNYKATILNSTTLDHDEATFQVPIPDSLAGAVRARLHFTVHSWEDTSIRTSDFVLVNRVATFLTPPVEGSLTQDRIFDFTGGYPMVVEIAIGDLQRSQSPVSVRFFTEAHIYFGNIHIEVDFPLGSNPTYTPAPMWYGTTLAAPFHPAHSAKIGMDAFIYKVGRYDIWGSERDNLIGKDGDWRSAAGASVVYGTDILIQGELNSESEYGAYGTPHPIAKIQLLGNGAVLRTWDFSPAWSTYFGITTSINTAVFGPQVPGGRRVELYLVAYNTEGTPSKPSYVGGTESGEYYPVVLRVL
ncbi:hypothetical protein DFJ74DRAFT_673225 [Hyaloraphidium curvatum]|nr:hypothetical protein DFJ74DRAFT_673225 [Hyaloraphidium curvatum]